MYNAQATGHPQSAYTYGNSQQYYGNGQSNPTLATPAYGQPQHAIVDPRFCLPYETVLVLREKMFNVTDDFYVTDITGRNHFYISGRMFSMRDKHTLYDINGQAVLAMHRDVFGLPASWYIHRGSSISRPETAVCKVRPKVFTLTPKLDVFAKITDGHFAEQPFIKVKGDFLDRNFQITSRTASGQEQLLTQVTRQWTMGYMPEQYYLRILPGVDMAAIVALCMITEEEYCEDRD